MQKCGYRMSGVGGTGRGCAGTVSSCLPQYAQRGMQEALVEEAQAKNARNGRQEALVEVAQAQYTRHGRQEALVFKALN